MLAGRALAAGGRAGARRDRARRRRGRPSRRAARCRAGDAADRELRQARAARAPAHAAREGRRHGIESLTERELEVARLVVDRRTNAQIAAELFLSPKTVETHIRHLFQKLEVSSRVEVARVVERADRDARPLTK